MTDARGVVSGELGLAVAERPVLAFHFDEIDHEILGAQPDAFAQAVRQGPVEAPFHFGITTFVQRHLDHDRISGAFDPKVGLVDHKVGGRMLGEDVESFFQRDLERRMHGLLDRLTHRCSILSRFARGQFNANEGHRFISYRVIAPCEAAVQTSRIVVGRGSSLLDETAGSRWPARRPRGRRTRPGRRSRRRSGWAYTCSTSTCPTPSTPCARRWIPGMSRFSIAWVLFLSRRWPPNLPGAVSRLPAAWCSSTTDCSMPTQVSASTLVWWFDRCPD